MSTPILTIENLNKSFGAVTAAREVSVVVPDGVVWSMIGSNGAGKTTFVNMVTGYIKPDTGRILFDGTDITKMSPRQVTRLGIRRSFQIPQLFAELTMLENMLVSLSINRKDKPSYKRSARKPGHVDEAMDTLKRFRIEDYHDRLMSELPAGVRKLLDIAMAMSGKPRVMLLDEPTSGVAAEEKFPLMDLVMEVLSASNVTVMFVEHDMDIVTRYSERVLAFYDGEIIANDAPDQVLSDKIVQRYITGTTK
ncbi:MAG: ATP-binding cassette domain-containing protein [Rhizobiales bacterium]|nr:ATP-binding cassette domain-containing protein [Hyphomicrobiales bacterium]